MYLIVGLGNPGKEYERTRHNMGFMSIDAIAEKYNVSFQKQKFGGTYAEFTKFGEKVILLKPQRYINLSGEVIKKYVDCFKIPISNVLIICDDLDTLFGNIKIKYKGSSGGHNGLKNIEQHLGTREYKRIKIGISNEKNIDTRDYVLSKIPNSELEKLQIIIDIVCNIVDDYFNITFENLMNKYNHRQ